MPSLPSVTDVKTYLGLTGTGDDALITERLAAAVSMAERDTGRVFSAASNCVSYYSTNNEVMVSVRDMPLTDPSRVVSWNGVTLNEGSSPNDLAANVWFLPDRRDPNITTSVQLRFFGSPTSYLSDPNWWDKGLDWRYYQSGRPNDLKISGIEGHPFPKADVTGAILVLTAFLFWRAKSGATGAAYSITGEPVSLAETPPEYRQFVADWKVSTAVESVGG